jgi:dipeptidyl aminopeptidase/acylaminoacyl peptidase
MAACTTMGGNEATTDDIIGRVEPTVTDHRLTAELLQEMGRVTDVQPSPDGSQLLYGVTYTSIAQNKTNRELYIVHTDGTNNHAITHTATSEQNAVWLKDGRIAFLSRESGTMQIWVMDADGSNRRQVSHFALPTAGTEAQPEECDIEGFIFSPDQQQVLIVAALPVVNAVQTRYPDLDKATGQVFDDLMYRHWNDFVRDYPHPFLASFDGQTVGTPTDVLEGEPYECPMRPFNGTEDFSFSPDGKRLVYACRKKTGRDYALSTHSDLYLYDIATATTRNLTGQMQDMAGYNTAPAFSPDGTKLAWQSMARDGYESDKQRLMLLDMTQLNATPAEGLASAPIAQATDLTAAYRDNCDQFVWAPTGDHLYFRSYVEATCQVYRLDLADTTITRVSDGGDYDFGSLTLAGTQLIATRHSMSAPDDIYALNEETHEATQLTFENRHILDQLELGRVEKRWMRCTNGDSMLVWVALPAGFDRLRAENPEAKFPTLLYCQGGPQSPVSQFWSIRWNIQMMQAHGYAVVLPNRHGVPGFGQPFNEQISGDYSGQCIDDYLTAIDEVAKEPWCDREHLGAVGASFGGYSVYYLAGHHEKRFKCFIAHAGIFNLESMYAETEENWFSHWDMGGAYWEQDNATAQRTFAHSPHKAVGQWDTPILVIHGEKDYRIPATEGMQAFNAAKLRGVPAEMLYFPDECHWVQQPQNCVLWQRVFFEWLDRWLKTDNGNN